MKTSNVTDPAVDCDYLTVLGTAGPANKRVIRSHGGIEKHAGQPIGQAGAVTIHVPDADAMASLLGHGIGNSTTLILVNGFVPGTEPAEGEFFGEAFQVMSRGEISKATGIAKYDDEALDGWHDIEGVRTIARTKDNFLPTSWFLWDRDLGAGIPAELGELSYEAWLARMESFLPQLVGAASVMMPSTTGRVAVDGVPMESAGSHTWMQSVDGFDVPRFGATALMKAHLAGVGYMKPRYSTADRETIVGHQPWTLFDPSRK